MPGLMMGFKLRVQFPECHTLKDRRARVQSLIHRAKSRYGFSAADLSDPLKVDYAELGLAVVGQTESEIRRRLDRVLGAAESQGEMELLGIDELTLTEET